MAATRTHRGRLTDERGASILMALFFVLVAMAVAAVVLSFSAVNGERTKQHATEEQAYFAVTSAMREADALLGHKDGIVVASADGATFTGGPGSAVKSGDGFAPHLAAWAADSVNALNAGKTPQPYEVTVSYRTTQGSSHVGGSIPSDVTLRFSMDAERTITVEGWQGELPSEATVTTSDYNYPLTKSYGENDEDGRESYVTWGVSGS